MKKKSSEITKFLGFAFYSKYPYPTFSSIEQSEKSKDSYGYLGFRIISND